MLVFQELENSINIQVETIPPGQTFILLGEIYIKCDNGYSVNLKSGQTRTLSLASNARIININATIMQQDK